MSPVTASRGAAAGCSSHSADLQPYPRIQLPCRGCDRTRSSASARPLAPSSFTSCCESDHVGKWTCESVKPGRTQRPPRSTTSGLGSAISWVPDTACDVRPRDRECACGRQRRVHRADDPVLEDHAERLYRRRGGRKRNDPAAERPASGTLRDRNPHSRIPFCAEKGGTMFDHVGLNVADFETSRRFFERRSRRSAIAS